MSGYTNPTESSYIAFCNAMRDEVRAANPTAEFGQMGRLLRARWNNMSENEKASYAVSSQSEPCVFGLRRSSRLRNKRLGLNFWGIKLKN